MYNEPEIQKQMFLNKYTDSNVESVQWMLPPR